ncbi:hypothetical protein EXIGLDRAFT_777285 [Exidia glandulosa HHB12029]|uniref:F-box domain-containing protein n=1 Tax=Exidia glandulosa HHB12029 TaxID=1314781 RepID=A0A165ZLA0_EXIGL|nr:hypothetical protein EXIGLDRAFT_777285 [Exidia glandulosa HHB12029]
MAQQPPAALPIDLVCEILAHSLLDAIAHGRMRCAAGLLTISKLFHAILRPLFFRRLVILRASQKAFVQSLRNVSHTDPGRKILRDVRHIYLFRYLNGNEAALVASTLEPSHGFAPTALALHFTGWQGLLSISKAGMHAVTHYTTFFPDSTHNYNVPYWTVDTSKVSAVLDCLPNLTHIVLRLSAPAKGSWQPLSSAATKFRYDVDAFLEVFRQILVRRTILKVVVRFSAFFPPIHDEAVVHLRTLEDIRVLIVLDETEADPLSYITDGEIQEALREESVWMLGKPVYEPSPGRSKNVR